MAPGVARRGGREGGADSPIRTDDLPLTRRLLYQLSYAGDDGHAECLEVMMVADGRAAEALGGDVGGPRGGERAF